MKKRQGFVSNSSSSSFIVAFPNISGDYNNFDTKILKHWSPKVTRQVWHDILSQLGEKAFSEKEFSSCLTGLFYSETYDELEKQYPTKQRLALFELVGEKVREKALDRWTKFKKENPDTSIFLFEYEDGNGEFFSYMEHGGIFDHLPNIRISHH